MKNRNEVATESKRPVNRPRELKPLDDLTVYLREYARERPDVVALSCFTLGFILGWKLKFW